jgi:hypothetical protein
MRVWRAILVAVLVTLVVSTGGCFLKKKKPAVPAPQAQAPSVAPAPQPATQPPPPAASEPNRPQPDAASSEATAAPPAQPVTKPKPKRNHVAKKPAPPPAPAPAPEKPSRTVVEQGGARPATGPQLSASLPHDTAIHQRLNTAQLLEATEYNLKTVSRALTADEQAMVQHIRSYMQQSREATKDGDVERAYNLAMKAHLLSDELIKP